MIRNICKILNQRIFVKLFCLLSVCSILPIVILSAIFMLQLDDKFTKTVIGSHHEIAKGYSLDIQSFMNAPIQALRSYSSLLDVLFDNHEKIDLALTKLSLDMPIFSVISVVDTRGNYIASSDLVQGDGSRQYVSQELLHRANSGELAVSSLSMNSEHIPFIDIALPCFVFGNIEFILVARLNLIQLWEIVDAISIGDTGRACIVDGSNRQLIAHWDKKKLFNSEVFPYVLPYENGDGATNGFLKNSERTLMYCAPIDGFNWYLAIQQDRDEVYYFYDMCLMYFGISVLCVFVLAVLVCFFVARRFVLPIEHMSDAAQKIGNHDFDVSLVPHANDELGKLTESFNSMAKKLKRAHENERLAMFSYTAVQIAHKLKNAIVTIKTYAQLFGKRRNDKGFLKNMEEGLLSEVSRVESMLGRFSHLKVDELPVADIFDVCQTVRRSLDTLQPTFDKSKIMCQCHLPQHAVYLEGNEDELLEVFMNLVRNAIDAMSHGGTLTVAIMLERSSVSQSNSLSILFEDTGDGMSEQDLAQLFMPFKTTKVYGMGIGLVYCKRVLETHYCATIQFDSQKGKGTKVLLAFPHVLDGRRHAPTREKHAVQVKENAVLGTCGQNNDAQFIGHIS